MSSDAKTSMPSSANPMSVMMIGGFQAVYTGIMYAVLKYVNPGESLPQGLRPRDDVPADTTRRKLCRVDAGGPALHP